MPRGGQGVAHLFQRVDVRGLMLKDLMDGFDCLLVFAVADVDAGFRQKLLGVDGIFGVVHGLGNQFGEIFRRLPIETFGNRVGVEAEVHLLVGVREIPDPRGRRIHEGPVALDHLGAKG